MGAYSNPQAVIDNQSGQYIRELQKNIVGTVESLGASYTAKVEKRNAEFKATQMKVGEEESAMYRNLASVQQTNPTVNFEELYRPMIKEYATLRTSILNGTSQDPSADRMKADKIFASVSTIKNSLVDLSAEGFVEKYDKAGGANGYAIGENDQKVMDSMLIFHGKLPGVKKGRFVDNDPTNFVWDVYDKGGQLIQTLSAEQLKNTSQGKGLLKVIPDGEKAITNIKDTATNIFETKDGIATGKIKPEFLDPTPFDKELPGKKTIVQGGVEYEQKSYMPSAKVDIEKMKADLNLNTLLDAKSEGFIKASASGIDAVLFNNTYFKNMPGFQLLDADEPLSPEAAAKFKENFKTFYFDSLPKDQPLEGAEKSQIIEKPAPKQATKKPKLTTKPKKEPSTVEKSDERIDRVLGNNVTGEAIGPSGNRFKKSKNGSWYKVDEDENQISEPLTREQVASKLGYKPLLKNKQ
jgi:hypothetical protein